MVKKGGVFDEKKLNWVCGQHMSGKSSQDLLNTMRELEPDWHNDQDENYLFNVIEMVKSRTKSLSELNEFSGYFFADPQSFDEKAVRKRWKDASVTKLMNRYWMSLHELTKWEPTALEASSDTCRDGKRFCRQVYSPCADSYFRTWSRAVSL